jgi:hypothetical protein
LPQNGSWGKYTDFVSGETHYKNRYRFCSGDPHVMMRGFGVRHSATREPDQLKGEKDMDTVTRVNIWAESAAASGDGPTRVASHPTT